jgi:putative flavoprotein involved in K+ transport
MAVAGDKAQCSGGLASLVANADLKQARLLRRIDDFVSASGLDRDVGPVTVPAPTRLHHVATELDLAPFSTVVWATGYRPTYEWLDAAAFGRSRKVVHDGGVARLPGLYLMGLPFMRRRRSNLIGGMRLDAADLAGHLRGFLDDVARTRTIRGGMAGSGRTGQHPPIDRSSSARSVPSSSTSESRVTSTTSCNVEDIGATASIACASIAPRSSTASSVCPIRCRAIMHRESVCHC